MVKGGISRQEANAAVHSALRQEGVLTYTDLTSVIEDVRSSCAFIRDEGGLHAIPPEPLPPLLLARTAKHLGRMRGDVRAKLATLTAHPVIGRIAEAVMRVVPEVAVKPARTEAQMRDDFLKHVRRTLSLADGVFSGLRYVASHCAFVERQNCPYIRVPPVFPADSLKKAHDKLRGTDVRLVLEGLRKIAQLPHDGALILLLRDVYNNEYGRWCDPEEVAICDEELDPLIARQISPGAMVQSDTIRDLVERCYEPARVILEDPTHPAVMALRGMVEEFDALSPVAGTKPRTVRNELADYCTQMPEEMTPIMRVTAEKMERVAIDLFETLDAADIDPNRTCRAEQLTHKTTPQEVDELTAFMQVMLMVSFKLKYIANAAAREKDKKSTEGLALLARDTVRSSVCQSLLLRYIHRHYPLVFAPHRHDASNAQKSVEFGHKMQYLSSLLQYIGNIFEPWSGANRSVAQRALAQEVTVWLDSLKEFSRLQHAALSQMPTGQPDERPDIALPDCPPPIIRTQIATQLRTDGDADNIAMVTRYALGYGHSVRHTVSPTDHAYIADLWMREPGAPVCHDASTVIPLCRVLPADTVANIYVSKRQTRPDKDFNDWMEAARQTGIDTAMHAMRERGAEANLISFLLMQPGQAECDHASFFLMDAKEAELVLSPHLFAVDTEEQREQIAALQDVGVPMYPQNAVIFWTSSNGWDEQEEPTEEERPLGEEEVLLHRVKNAMLQYTHSDILTADDVHEILKVCGIAFTAGKSGGGHHEFVSARGKFASPNKPVKDNEWYRNFVEKIIIAVGDIDAFERWVEAQRPAKRNGGGNGTHGNGKLKAKR